MSFDGTVTMFIMEAPQTFAAINGFLGDTEPNLFLASLSESRGRDSF